MQKLAMANKEESLEIPSTTHEAFNSFLSNDTLLALPLQIDQGTTIPLEAVSNHQNESATFQASLSRLESLVNPRTALYLLLRYDNSLTAITYVPHFAHSPLKQQFLDHRYALVRALGPQNFASMMICKEPGEILDDRSWKEREGEGESLGGGCGDEGIADAIEGVRDLGYKKNKCRLCDRRMKYGIEERAADALKKLDKSGSCVQLCVDITTETLVLASKPAIMEPAAVSTQLSTSSPTLTFYRHPSNSLLYFIFCSPDSAPVKERMMHTMAIPGLHNIITKDLDLQIDQKIEIHEPEELEFQDHDERIGRFRSMYLLNGKMGTESQWKGMPVS